MDQFEYYDHSDGSRRYYSKGGPMASTINRSDAISVNSADYFVPSPGSDKQAPNQEVTDNLVGILLEALEGVVSWRTEPATTLGPYGGRPTNVTGLIETDDGYQGFFLQLYVNPRSTEEAVSLLERQREDEKRKAYVAALIEGPLALEPPKKGGRK